MWATHLSLYLQPPNFGHLLHFGPYICECVALCVLVVRIRVKRWAISMFKGILEEVDILILIRVRSLKTYITQS